jgi:acylphosphatase
MRSRELLELRAIVTGRVQGVGFRSVVKSCAVTLQLVGFVCNLADGSVEICAQGEKSVLERLLEQIKQEFGHYIKKIECDFRPIQQTYSDFNIKRL